ncbi:MAG TPA: phosphohistidine phosphatase SixA [Vicinamibacterales bacterium]|nr:phosphohistidine phosphatase SixA [Vicinamibacterales bacterium]
MPTLFLIRHAIAEERGEDWPDDTLRPLTAKGAARMKKIAERLVTLDETAEIVLTSPLTRAVETAQILKAVWTPSPAVSIVDALAPDHTPAATAAALGKFKAPARVAVVGHEPDLGAFAAWVIGTRIPLVFKKGGVARFDLPAWPPTRAGQLVWLASPKILLAGR